MAQKVLVSLDMSGNAINNLPDAVSAQQPVTKAQLDASIQGLKWKDPVRCATTANITLSGTQAIDGVTVVAGDRVLVKNQSTASANGIYVVAAGSWTRATDFDASSELLGAAIFVSEGSTLGNQQWQLTTDGPLTIGTTSLTFTQFGGGTSYTAGTGITVNAGVIAIDTAVTARKSSASIGNGSATSFNVNHALGTTDVMVFVRETAGGLAAVICDVAVVDANNVSVSFATAPSASQYRVMVVG